MKSACIRGWPCQATSNTRREVGIGASGSDAKALLRIVVAAIATALCSWGHAAPPEFVDGCYVRPEPASPAASGVSQSHLGLRRQGTQLVEVNVAVAGANGAVCSVAGIAKWRGGPGAEYLSLVVRPDSGLQRHPGHALCQLRIQGTPTAVELATTEPSCQAQSLCAGAVQLDGQRFELSGRVPAAGGPCFASPAR